MGPVALPQCLHTLPQLQRERLANQSLEHIARSFGFSEREFFEVSEGEKAVPKVDFSSDG